MRFLNGVKIKNKDYFKSSLWSDKNLAVKILEEIKILSRKASLLKKGPVNIMEVCGTHTMAIASSGIRNILPESINLLSGPGCPVCVTSAGDIDRILQLSRLKNAITATFGDMLKVRNSSGEDLNSVRASGRDVRIVYSPSDALGIARANPDKNVIFVGVGFETTAPLIASVIKTASAAGVKNFYVTSLFKLVPPALKILMENKAADINAFILPGHVSAIIGYRPYEFVPAKYGIPCSVCGFEPLDILRGISALLRQIVEKKPRLDVEYSRVVSKDGNAVAKALMAEVFSVSAANWRAIGVIPGSGYDLSPEYDRYDAFSSFGVKYSEKKEPSGCLCGKILLGVAKPVQCRHFGKACTPLNAIGPCMVSSEGACAAWYKYGVKK
ncbi:MAG: hydrogenase formation protein HypD [Elusimicrobia bacterium CG08_land_8_20_14_0_20_51_18]|nr:MAG: hydrogenase formation protein HypD [Elusimicrobia bacterium CG08_land_8_20_14_0_20_51_18]